MYIVLFLQPQPYPGLPAFFNVEKKTMGTRLRFLYLPTPYMYIIISKTLGSIYTFKFAGYPHDTISKVDRLQKQNAGLQQYLLFLLLSPFSSDLLKLFQQLSSIIVAMVTETLSGIMNAIKLNLLCIIIVL